MCYDVFDVLGVYVCFQWFEFLNLVRYFVMFDQDGEQVFGLMVQVFVILVQGEFVVLVVKFCLDVYIEGVNVYGVFFFGWLFCGGFCGVLFVFWF